MKKDFFKPEDFDIVATGEHGKALSAHLANKKLNKLIESWPVAYGTKDNNGQHFHENTNGNYNPTHTARLAFIEEIKKECVKHEPEFKTFKFTTANNEVLAADFNFLKCKHCGVELVTTWSEKK